MENLSTHQYTIENKTTYAFVTNVTTGKVFSVTKNTARIEKIGNSQVAILNNATLKPIVVFEYANLQSPASTDIDNLIETVLGPYFFNQAGGGGGSISPGTTLHSTLRWDGNDWVESLTLLNDDTAVFSGGIYKPIPTISVAGFLFGTQWNNTLSDVSGSKSWSAGHTTGTLLVNRNIRITPTSVNIRSEATNKIGFNISMDDLQTKISQRNNNAGEITIYYNTGGAAVTADVGMYPVMISAQNASIDEDTQNAVCAGGDSLQIYYSNTLAHGGNVMGVGSILADTVMTGDEGWSCIFCDTTAGVINLTLPNPVEIGRNYYIKNSTAVNNVVVIPAAGTIEGLGSVNVATDTAIQIILVAFNDWRIIANYP